MNAKTIAVSEFVSVITYTALGFVLMAVILLLFFYFSRKKIVKYELEKRDLIIAHQKEMLTAVLNTQEVERKRIAQDLHDDISSNLNIVSLNSHLLQRKNLSEREIDEITANIVALTKKSLENSRRIAHDLYPPVLEKFGLEAGIKEICYDFSTTKAVTIDFKNDLNFLHIKTDMQVQIFRILQELISNSMRHGKAKNIKFHFFKTVDNHNACDYQDDGIGFDIKLTSNQQGMGLKNIESRINFIGGTIDFGKSSSSGVQIKFNF